MKGALSQSGLARDQTPYEGFRWPVGPTVPSSAASVEQVQVVGQPLPTLLEAAEGEDSSSDYSQVRNRSSAGIARNS